MNREKQIERILVRNIGRHARPYGIHEIVVKQIMVEIEEFLKKEGWTPPKDKIENISEVDIKKRTQEIIAEQEFLYDPLYSRKAGE